MIKVWFDESMRVWFWELSFDHDGLGCPCEPHGVQCIAQTESEARDDAFMASWWIA